MPDGSPQLIVRSALELTLSNPPDMDNELPVNQVSVFSPLIDHQSTSITQFKVH